MQRTSDRGARSNRQFHSQQNPWTYRITCQNQRARQIWNTSLSVLSITKGRPWTVDTTFCCWDAIHRGSSLTITLWSWVPQTNCSPMTHTQWFTVRTILMKNWLKPIIMWGLPQTARNHLCRIRRSRSCEDCRQRPEIIFVKFLKADCVQCRHTLFTWCVAHSS